MRVGEGARPPARRGGLPLSKPAPIPAETWAALRAALLELHERGLALESSSLVLERGLVNGEPAGARVVLELRYLPGGLTAEAPPA